MTDEEVFVALPVEVEKRGIVPKVKVGPKSSFWYHAAINVLLNLFYAKGSKDAYLTRFWTTIGYTISWPDDEGRSPSNWAILCHELKHAAQAARWTRPLFSYLYLWPLSQGLLILLLGWVGLPWTPGWWKLLYAITWVALAVIHFIPQIPDPWRTHWELQAYTISIFFHVQRYGRLEDWYLDGLVHNFSSMTYYMMAPRKDRIRKALKEIGDAVEARKHPVKDDPIVRAALSLKGSRSGVIG